MSEESEKYNELLDLYSKIWGNGRLILERKIEELVKNGLTREEAIDKLYQEEVEISKSIKMKMKYDGKKWGIIYLPISDFEEELPSLGKILDYVEERYGDVVAVIPNVGLTPTSLLLGTSFQGVKGFGIVYRKRVTS